MILGRYADANGMCQGKQFLQGAADGGKLLDSSGILRNGIIDIDVIHPLLLRIDAHMISAHRADADDSNIHVQASKLFTVSAMYSISSWLSEGWTGRLITRRESSSDTGHLTLP